MLSFRKGFLTLLGVAFLQANLENGIGADGRAIETTITLYRVGPGGRDPKQSIVPIGTPSAVGVGGDGGTTYDQSAAHSATSTVVAPPASLVSIFDYTTTIQNGFVEKSGWVYQSVPDSSGAFNTLEQNCTLSDAGNSSVCIEVDVKHVDTTITASTTTYSATPVAWFTFTVTSTVPDPAPTIQYPGGNGIPSGAGRFELVKYYGSLQLIVIVLLAL